MNLQALGSVGGLVVMISVIYLAIQIRHSTHAQRTQNSAVALDRLSNFQARMSRDADFADLLLAGVTDITAFEFMFHQAEEGTMPDVVWQRWRTTLQWWMAFPGVQAWWDSRPSPFTGSFCTEVARLRSAGLPDPAAQWRWREFLRGAQDAAMESPE
ncbi:MAG: hypothetical protein RIC56_20190 [Pseudomonadales bacterium]